MVGGHGRAKVSFHHSQEAERKERSRDKIYPSKVCLSDLHPPARSHLLLAHFAMDSSMVIEISTFMIQLLQCHHLGIKA
jgi:hypothetical protein